MFASLFFWGGAFPEKKRVKTHSRHGTKVSVYNTDSGLPSKVPCNFRQGRMHRYASHASQVEIIDVLTCAILPGFFRRKVQLKAWRSLQSLLKCWRKTSRLATVSSPLTYLNPWLTLLSLPRVCLPVK